MIVDGDGLGLCVKMVDVGHLHAACGCSEGSILEGLDFVDGGGGGVGEPNGSCICIEGPNEGLEGDDECFLLLPPGGASKSSKEIEAGGSAGDEE